MDFWEFSVILMAFPGESSFLNLKSAFADLKSSFTDLKDEALVTFVVDKKLNLGESSCKIKFSTLTESKFIHLLPCSSWNESYFKLETPYHVTLSLNPLKLCKLAAWELAPRAEISIFLLLARPPVSLVSRNSSQVIQFSWRNSAFLSKLSIKATFSPRSQGEFINLSPGEVLIKISRELTARPAILSSHSLINFFSRSFAKNPLIVSQSNWHAKSWVYKLHKLIN